MRRPVGCGTLIASSRPQLGFSGRLLCLEPLGWSPEPWGGSGALGWSGSLVGGLEPGVVWSPGCRSHGGGIAHVKEAPP